MLPGYYRFLDEVKARGVGDVIRYVQGLLSPPTLRLNRAPMSCNGGNPLTDALTPRNRVRCRRRH